MRRLLLIAGVTALASAAPALADPPHGKGKGKGNPQAGQIVGAPVGYGVGACPPGLAKKNNGCLPPGQAKKLYNIGQRWPGNYGYAWNYNQIPYDMRTRYGFDPRYQYYYGDGYLYRVDPATMVIREIVSAILR